MMNVIERCQAIASLTEQPGAITRTFLSPPVRQVHQLLRGWMEELGMRVWLDAAGNLHGACPDGGGRKLLIGSHIDTVPNAGAYDGVLGVVIGLGVVEALQRRVDIEVVAFSEEEGVRFGVPFIGSRALVGTLDTSLLNTRDTQGITVEQALRTFGLDPAELPAAIIDPAAFCGYLEFHIEQGPVLDSLNLPLGIVTAIAGQSRYEVVFRGKANHAGTTPMHLRRDALAAAARWISVVEREARGTHGLVATVGRVETYPGAGNVIAGEVRATLDVRHAEDPIRCAAVDKILGSASAIACRRRLKFEMHQRLNQPAVQCDPGLVNTLDRAVAAAGFPAHRMVSGAGHDAMILASRVPAAMLFLRSPEGISHHPDESVLPGDIAAALEAGVSFITELSHA